MTYKGEAITNRLRQARQALGLSQRALAERAGLTQSHISQIENGATDPGLSSLVDLARALGLEVMLVPRKRLPAVSSLIATASPARQPIDPAIRREFDRGEALIEAISQRTGSTASLDRLRETLAFLRQVPMDDHDRSTVLEVLKAMDTLRRRQDSPEVGRRAREAADALQSVRNRLAHARPAVVKAAYTLDSEDEDG